MSNRLRGNFLNGIVTSITAGNPGTLTLASGLNLAIPSGYYLPIVLNPPPYAQVSGTTVLSEIVWTTGTYSTGTSSFTVLRAQENSSSLGAQTNIPSAATHTITYNYEGGTGTPTSIVITAGNSTILPIPAYTGYTFNGWYTAASGGTLIGSAGVSYSPSSNITLYAQWTSTSSYPSGFTPPSTPEGMTQLYFDDFIGDTLNEDLWGTYEGAPGGTEGWWLPSHVTVGSYGSTTTASICNLNMYYDPAGSGENGWCGGGMGAYTDPAIPVGSQAYVSMRLDPYAGSYFFGIFLLIGANNTWPPEIDAVEAAASTSGNVSTNNATAHYSSSNKSVQQSISDIDLTIWHVWGVEWGQSTISYTLDGTVWASIANPSASDPTDPNGLYGNIAQNLSLQIQVDPTVPAENTSITASNPIKQQIDWVIVFIPS